MRKSIPISLVLMLFILAGAALFPVPQSTAMEPSATEFLMNDCSGNVILAKMDKPPIKLTPNGGGTGGGCMSSYRPFYAALQGQMGSDMPNAPIPGTACHTCLQNQASQSRPWSNAAYICLSPCCQ